jgi:hypothetical protein
LKKTEKKVLSTKGKVFLCFRLTCEGPLIFSLSRNNADDKVTALFKLQGGAILLLNQHQYLLRRSGCRHQSHNRIDYCDGLTIRPLSNHLEAKRGYGFFLFL